MTIELKQEPIANHCSNKGRDDYWTCPGCYTDLGDCGSGEVVCDKCGNLVKCTIEYEPACHAQIIGESED